MVSDIATATTDVATPAEAKTADDTTASALARRRRRFSPLTWRILAINVFALAVLGGGVLYLGEYRQSLVDAELQSLKTQAQVFAAGLGEGATMTDAAGVVQLSPQRARDLMRRLVEPTKMRAQLLDGKGTVIADTAVLGSAGSAVQVDPLTAPEGGNAVQRRAIDVYDWSIAHLSWLGGDASPSVPNRIDGVDPTAQRAFAGDVAVSVRGTAPNLILVAAAPVQYYRQVLGVVLLSNDGSTIEQTVRGVRLAIVELFAVALGLTVLLSIYLAGTIARPVRRLAAAAERVRRGQGREVSIPDFTNRGDEIGDLSGALREMTATLWLRMDAIEHFAADVAHEIKNPLTSLRSAVETAARVADAEKQRRLLAVIVEDVKRLDRLITDISDASRLDAELSRDTNSTVPVDSLLAALIDLYRDIAKPDAPFLRLDLSDQRGASPSALPVLGSEDQLVRVFRNLLDNAISFSPPSGTIIVRARRIGETVRVTIDDQGPGIPPSKLAAIFNRFYTERPVGEAFGTHSGLGLAIAKQIAEAHRGGIRAENRHDTDGNLIGARFIVDLPLESTRKRS
jgi:two-component system sensor histidine kinase ChvG